MACVEMLFFRDGRLLGNNSFFPHIPRGEVVDHVLEAFLAQHYLGKPVPEKILVSQELAGIELLTEVLQKHTGRQVMITSKARGEHTRWLEMALRNAEHALSVQLSSQAGMRRRFEALKDALGLDFLLSRLECFDVSHTQGEATVAACIVFTEQGPLKSAYRRYNIEGLTPSDDYGALRQALTRRYMRLLEKDGKLPDILFIDGGKGQVAQARQVLAEFQVTGVMIIGIAKGAGRKSGSEVLHLAEKNKVIQLPADSAALHLVQQVRDEAHRFAITGHRQRRAKARKTSILESISGIGQKRRQTLLRQFGGLKQLSRAAVEDIARVNGISKALAERIYDSFHNDD
jgi:excinuclease ABC subunit C